MLQKQKHNAQKPSERLQQTRMKSQQPRTKDIKSVFLKENLWR